MIDAYSPYKALRHWDVIKGIQQGRPTRPVHVQIILSDTCNQQCGFCAYRDPGYTSSQLFYEVDAENLTRGLRRDKEHPERNYNPARHIPRAKVLEILDDCAELGVGGIQYTGGGEPTVHPQFAEILNATRDRGLAFAVVTNGVNVAKQQLAGVMSYAEWVRISLDAGNPETYAKTRGVPPSQFESAIRALRDVRHERECNKTSCLIGAGFVVTPDNWREAIQATRAVKAAGADNIRISAQFSTGGAQPFADFYEQCRDLCKRAEHETTASFAVFNRFGARVQDLEQQAPDYPSCGYQFFTTYIGADLNLYRCCVYAYNPRGKFGSIRDMRFGEAWMATARAKGMNDFDARGCERCQFNGINRMLNYATRRDEPEHAEFV